MSGTYYAPYEDMTPLENGHFKMSNGHISKWSLEDIKYIKYYVDKGIDSAYTIGKDSKIDFYTISRLIATYKAGIFDEYFGDSYPDEINDVLETGSIHVYDGIHITNNYYNTVPDEPVKQKPKGNVSAWSKRVRERDNYTCVVCDKYDKKHMEAHHIEPKSIYPERATDDLNGVCICQRCHRKYNNRYEPKNQNMVTFSRFIADERRGY